MQLAKQLGKIFALDIKNAMNMWTKTSFDFFLSPLEPNKALSNKSS